MDYNEIMESLKSKCKKLLSLHKKEENKVKLYTAINEILNSDKPFDKIDIDVAVNLINSLVNDKEKSKEIYLALISNV